VVYELRVYDAIPGRLPDLQRRFRDHTSALFERHGIRPVVFLTPEIAAHSNQLVYLLAFPDLATRESAWAGFQADPDWQQAKRESEADGPLVANIASSILNPTDYSPTP
jgi:hypothetical protein